MPVRLLGRRVYLALVLAVVLVSAGRAESASASRLSEMLAVPVRTVDRWRKWWYAQFPLTLLWRAACARFMPPVLAARLPASLLDRFAGSAPDCLMRLLLFLTALTVDLPIALWEGRYRC
jgi:hypothetical protein